MMEIQGFAAALHPLPQHLALIAISLAKYQYAGDTDQQRNPITRLENRPIILARKHLCASHHKNPCHDKP
jgi:hypothetical protein